MPLLSFSIDLSRSTEVKSLINKIAGNNPTHKDNLIKEYYQILLNVEKQLYEQFLHSDLNLEELFLVKSIGDELWYVYELDDDKLSEKQINNIIIKIFYILAGIITHVNRMLITERDVFREEEEKNLQIWDTVKHKEIFLPTKCFVDILDDCYCFSEERNDVIVDILYNHIHFDQKNKGLAKAAKDNVFKSTIPKIAENLNLGLVDIDNNKVKFNYIRFDTIGRDVDLFFRCCGEYSLPCLLRIGLKLFNYIALDIKEDEFRIEYGENQSVTKNIKFNYAPVEIKQMKGIDQEYSAFTVFIGYNTLPLSGQRTLFENDGCDKAREYLIKYGFIKKNYFKNLYTKYRKGHMTYPINRKKWRYH